MAEQNQPTQKDEKSNQGNVAPQTPGQSPGPAQKKSDEGIKKQGDMA